jgi:hypothetical protein
VPLIAEKHEAWSACLKISFGECNSAFGILILLRMKCARFSKIASPHVDDEIAGGRWPGDVL